MSPASQPNKSRVVVPRPLKWHQRQAALLIYLVVRCLSATWRFHWPKDNPLFKEQFEQTIFCAWHNRLALCLPHYRQVRRRHPSRKLAAVVSASRDGGMLARILELFGVQPVRGSSSRRGAQALLEMTTFAERGMDLAITPDGPRGPLYIVQDGIMSLAQLTGLPILPASYHVNWKVSVRSWDRFQIPLPFARVEVRFGETIRVPRDASEEQREELRKKLEATMTAITRD
jgi:lysophospholipid acyltransferase (LPLAT)-like uncharacterized protein